MYGRYLPRYLPVPTVLYLRYLPPKKQIGVLVPTYRYRFNVVVPYLRTSKGWRHWVEPSEPVREGHSRHRVLLHIVDHQRSRWDAVVFKLDEPYSLLYVPLRVGFTKLELLQQNKQGGWLKLPLKKQYQTIYNPKIVSCDNIFKTLRKIRHIIHS